MAKQTQDTLGRFIPSGSDPRYLLTEQYHNAAKLQARIQLHQRFSTNPYGWMRWVFDQFELPTGCSILELGCGPGSLWVENSHRIDPGWEIVLSDFSLGMLQEAQRNLGHSSQPFKFQVIDAQAIPFGNQRFDVVIANHMLYHVPDRRSAFAEIQRVLKPEGRFYATTIGERHLRELDDLVQRFNPQWHFLIREHAFSLENGAAQLAPWFADIHLRRYEDALVITEPEPLVAYSLSTIRLSQATSANPADLTRFVEQELAAHGAIHVTKDSGLFASRPKAQR